MSYTFADYQYDLSVLKGDLKEKEEERQKLLDINENLVEKLEETRKELMDCRNELCLKCGRYTDRHMGACDGCRWKDMDKWKS